MTEKRFRYYETIKDTQIWDSQRNAFYDDYDLDKITECLNALHKENQQLKEDIDELDKKSDELHDEKIRLIRENTRLKKKLKEHNDMLEWHQGGW